MTPEKVNFDAYAANYDEALESALSVTGEDKNYFARRRAVITARVLAGLGCAPARMLDFGCGTGSATPFLFEHLPLAELVGTDPSLASLEVAAAQWNEFAARFVPIEKVPGLPGFDLAYCNGVFHHIAPAERAASVALVRDALGPGGRFAFWENNPWNPGTRWVMSRCEFDRDAVPIPPPAAARLLCDSGLEVERTSFHFYFPAALRSLRPIEAALGWVPLGGQYLILARRR
ncbi:MAG: class I SAM-dependent methyltransferase [Terrimicrobiaceae bacterium]|nr:class I SAM-dependent methyltransferase [Terrimicrobiaceae bacterium]